MNELTNIFNYEERQLRTVIKDNEVWFVAKDVCDILELTNSREAISNLEKDDVSTTDIIDSLGRSQNTNIINETGLYQLIFQSRKLEARSFQRWVTHDVLPSIRKHGIYATASKITEMLTQPENIIALFTSLHEEQTMRKQLQIENAEMKPKASYYDLILQTTNGMPITQIAKDYGMTAMKFNLLLHDLHVQFKSGKTWLLYSDYADMDYTKSKTFLTDKHNSVLHTSWTQKGRLFIYNLLKNTKGIIPMMERTNTKTIINY